MPTELPIELKKLEVLPGALDIIRYLYSVPERYAHREIICMDLEITDRGFGKANRRLITNGYVQMRGDGVYELSSKGIQAARDLAEYDESAGTAPVEDNTSVDSRRLIMALPQPLVAGQTVNVLIGIDAPHNPKSDTTQLVLRVSAINASVEGGDDVLAVATQPVSQVVRCTPEAVDTARVRVEVYQLDPDGENIYPCGGLYVDALITGAGSPGPLVAYGADIALQSF